MSNEKVIGVDLGSGFSAVAVMELGKPLVIANSEGSRTTPSVIYIDSETHEVGGAAKRRMTMKPKNTVSFIKRFMGAEYTDPDVQKMLKQVSYEVVDKDNKPYVRIDGRDYSPEEISSYTLAKMKKTAEEYYGTEVTKAIITVPAWFNDRQRQATKTAGELAGLEVLRIINEPTAAILASNINLKDDDDKNVAVFDFGAGTLDISVANLSMADGQMLVEIKSSYGDVFLGGQNYDNALIDWMCEEFKKDHPDVDLKKDPMALSRMEEAAEKAKCELSSTTSTDINLPYITVEDGTPQHLVLTLTRAKFEQLTADITNKAMECTRKAIEKAGLKPDEISEILLVGGSTRIPSVQEALTREFGRPLDKSSNPDEVVALGAVTQANILVCGETDKDLLLLDVTPLSVGIETEGELMTVMIEGNTTIPTSKKNVFTTAVDNQPAVFIKIYQGERKFAKDNKLLGTFELGGILPARRGVPQIEVTFDIDANGILKVSAKDLGTGKENEITIKDSGGLSQEEIARIKADAEKFKAEDDRRKEEIDKLNAAEGYAYQIRNLLSDESLKGKFTEEQKKGLQEKVDAVIEAVKEKDLQKTETARTELENMWQPIASEMYKQAAGENGSGFDFQDLLNKAQQQGGTPPTDDNDVDFEEVK